MAVPINNAGLKSIQDEFGGDTLDGGISLSEYYKGGQHVSIGQLQSAYSIGIVPVEPNYYWVNPIDPPPPPVYSEISIGNFLGLQNALEISIVISQNLLAGFDLHAYITSNYPTWTKSIKVKATVTINAGVYIIGANTGVNTYAFDASYDFATGSTLKIINNGVISGRGGNGGNGGSYPNVQPTEGSPGGHGLNVSGIETTIINSGLIAGGGGGGAGGVSLINCINSRVGTDTKTTFTHFGGNGGGGGVPLGLAGSGNNCGQLTTADFTNFNLGYFSYEGDTNNDYYRMDFIAGVLGTSASLSNRGVGTTRTNDGIIANNWAIKLSSGDGGDYGMDGFLCETSPPSWATGYGDPSMAGMAVYGITQVINSTSGGKFGGAGGNAITGGTKISWEKYGLIRGDVDAWGKYIIDAFGKIDKNLSTQNVQSVMSSPSKYVNQTKIIAWGENHNFWTGAYGNYLVASSPVDNGKIYPVSYSPGYKNYRSIVENNKPYDVDVVLVGSCFWRVIGIRADNQPFNIPTFRSYNPFTGYKIEMGTEITRMSDGVYTTYSTIRLSPGAHVIEIKVQTPPDNPHFSNFSIQIPKGATLATPTDWFLV